MTPSTQKDLPDDALVLQFQRWLFVMYLFFVVYGSLVPLNFVPRPLPGALDDLVALGQMPLDFSSRSDWAANLMLFIPLTFLAGQSFLSRSRGMGKVCLAILFAVLASALAVGIELAQMFFPTRTASESDIVALSISGVIGMVAHGIWGRRVHLWLLGYWQNEMPRGKMARVLTGYLLLLFIFAVMPLDLTLSPAELFRKWRDGRVIFFPFGGWHGPAVQMVYQSLTDVLVWVPVGVLWTLQSKAGVLRLARRGFLVALFLELLQLFVLSRTTDVTTACMAAIGTALGGLVVHRAERNHFVLTQVSPTVWLRACGVWLVVVLSVFWLPFDFDVSRLTLAGMTDAFTRVPLNNYYFESEFIALNEVLRKIGFFVPVGLLWGLAGRAPRLRPGAGVLGSIWPLFLLALLIESAQLMLPERVADLTDFLLESLGGWMGFRMAQWLYEAPLSQRSLVQPSGDAAPVFEPLVDAPYDPRKSTSPPVPYRAPSHWYHLVWIGVTGLLLGTVLHLPVMPYNVREMVAPGWQGLLSVVGLTLALHWMANGAFFLLNARFRPLLMALPLTLVVHGTVNWFLLRMGVPLESVFDVAGSPVLGWPWEWELIGRYLGLHMAMMLQISGAVLLVRTVLQPRHVAGFLYWLVITGMMCWPLYTLNVTWADTDNLVELIANDASFAASSALMVGFLALCVTASALSAAWGFVGDRRLRVRLVGLALVAASLASWMFWLGSEAVLVKYGKAFSAFQFLLSTDRAHYAVGMNLVLRYLVAFVGVVAGLAVLQLPFWRRLHAQH